jgi:hypothetical protein
MQRGNVTQELSTKPVVTIPKNAREEIWLALDEWTDPKGGSHNLCNMRIFAHNKGIMRPTQKGMSIDIGRLPDFIAGLETVRLAAIEKGWLDE